MHPRARPLLLTLALLLPAPGARADRPQTPPGKARAVIQYVLDALARTGGAPSVVADDWSAAEGPKPGFLLGPRIAILSARFEMPGTGRDAHLAMALPRAELPGAPGKLGTLLADINVIAEDIPFPDRAAAAEDLWDQAFGPAVRAAFTGTALPFRRARFGPDYGAHAEVEDPRRKGTTYAVSLAVRRVRNQVRCTLRVTTGSWKHLARKF